MGDKTARTARAGVTAPLRYRDFRLLMGAFAISCAGSWAYNVALAVLVFEQTDSLAWVGAATVGRFVPALLLGAYGGVVAERFERIRLMATVDWVCGGWMLLLAVVALLDGPVVRTTTVTALRDSRVRRISGEDFMESLTDAPASTALLEGARTRLARSHPGQPVVEAEVNGPPAR